MKPLKIKFVALQQSLEQSKANLDLRNMLQPVFQVDDFVFLEILSNIRIQIPSMTYQETLRKKMSPYFVGKLSSSTAQPDEDGIDNIVSINQQSNGKRREELMTHCDSDKYTTNTSNNDMTTLDQDTN